MSNLRVVSFITLSLFVCCRSISQPTSYADVRKQIISYQDSPSTNIIVLAPTLRAGEGLSVYLTAFLPSTGDHGQIATLDDMPYDIGADACIFLAVAYKPDQWTFEGPVHSETGTEIFPILDGTGYTPFMDGAAFKGVVLPGNYVHSAATAGIHVRLNGKPDSKDVHIPDYYVNAFLESITEIAAVRPENSIPRNSGTR